MIDSYLGVMRNYVTFSGRIARSDYWWYVLAYFILLVIGGIIDGVLGFNWDEGNFRKSAEKHGVSQSEAEEVFFNEPLLLLEDAKHSQTEARFHALGKTDDGRLLHITFTLRQSGTLIRVISARDMHRKERAVYEQAQKDA